MIRVPAETRSRCSAAIGERYNSASPDEPIFGLNDSSGSPMTTPEIQTPARLELRRFIDHVPALGWSALPDGSLDYVNQRFRDYTGLSPSELYGTGWQSAVHRDDIQLLESWYQEIRQSQEAGTTEVRLRRFDGSYRWFLVFANPLRDESGSIVEWYGTNVDIEDRKQAEEALRAKELSWLQIVDNIPGLVATMGATGEVEFLNRQTLEYFGKSRDDLKNWALSDAVHPDDLPRIIEARIKAIEGGSIYDVEHRCRRSDGMYRWFQVRGLPMRNTENAITTWYLLLTDIDDRKRAEQKVLQSEKELLTMTDAIANPIMVLDPDGKVLYANRVAQDKSGLSLDKVRKEGFLPQTLHPEDLDRVADERRAGLLEGRPFEMEMHISEKGEYRWQLVQYNPLKDEIGQIVRWYATATDIDDRKRAEEKLRQSEQDLRMITDSIRQPIVVLGADTRTLYANRVALDTTGLTQEEVIDQGFFLRAYHPDDVERLRSERQERFLRGDPFDLEMRVRQKSGQYRWSLIQYNPLRDERGQIIRWYGTATDIDDRKRAEEKLRQSEQELRTITDTIRQPIVVLAPDGTPLYANQVFFNFAGFTLGEVDAKGFLERACHPDELERVRDQRRAGLLKGAPFEVEIRALFKRTQYRWVLMQYNPLIDEQGKIIRWYATATDIDDRKRAEEQLRNENVKLERERVYLEEQIRSEMGYGQIIGNSAALKHVLELVETVAASDSTVLLLGETGTGKELIARAVHERSRRRAKTFVKLNCAAIPTGLLESELFGHEKGAFTGAIIQKVGRMELADQGTLFLDEVGDIPIDIQPKLLRALQEKEFERLGSTHTRKVNLRLVAATNRNLEQMVANREFRSDLFYRLNVFPIRIPPLRDRKEDIPMLVAYFVQKFAKQMQKRLDSIPVATMKALAAWEWPGNIRELENFIERAVILTTGESLAAPLGELRKIEAEEPVRDVASKSDDDIARIVKETIASMKGKGANDGHAKKQHNEIVRVLTECKGRVGGADGAAVRMGLSRTTLISRMKKLGINPYDYS
jgi:formate hydrogenlyase transcriptional activator